MGRGLFSGIVWGIVVTGLGLVVLALVGPAPTGPGEAPAPRLAARPEAPVPVAPEPAVTPADSGRPAAGALPDAEPATDIEVPPGSEFNRPPPEREVSLPGAELAARGVPPVRGPEPVSALAEAPLPDTAPSAAPAPVTSVPDGLAPPLSAEAPPDTAAEAPVLPAAGSTAPAGVRTGPVPVAPRRAPVADAGDRPAPEPQADAVAQPEAPAAEAPGAEDAQTVLAEAVPAPVPAETRPGTGAEVSAPDRVAPAPEPQADPASAEAAAPRIRPLPATDETEAPASEAAPDTAAEPLRVPAPGVRVDTTDIRIGRLPMIGAAPMEGPDAPDAPPSADTAPEAAADIGDAKETAAPGARLGALARNAAPFEPVAGRPLFSVILIDAGDQGLDRETLMTFSFPVTFAVDPTRPDAAEAVAAYRKAGYEVVALASGLPRGAVPADLEVALAAQEPILDRAVALMDVPAGGFQDDRAMTAQMAAFAGASGHGIVTFDRGLNTATRIADKAGVPQATVYRLLDGDRPNATTIRRMLERAVFKARQDGHVVVVGHSYSDTVTALYSWALEAAADQVSLAPLSTVLRLR